MPSMSQIESKGDSHNFCEHSPPLFCSPIVEIKTLGLCTEEYLCFAGKLIKWEIKKKNTKLWIKIVYKIIFRMRNKVKF